MVASNGRIENLHVVEHRPQIVFLDVNGVDGQQNGSCKLLDEASYKLSGVPCAELIVRSTIFVLWLVRDRMSDCSRCLFSLFLPRVCKEVVLLHDVLEVARTGGHNLSAGGSCGTELWRCMQQKLFASSSRKTGMHECFASRSVSCFLSAFSLTPAERALQGTRARFASREKKPVSAAAAWPVCIVPDAYACHGRARGFRTGFAVSPSWVADELHGHVNGFTRGGLVRSRLPG